MTIFHDFLSFISLSVFPSKFIDLTYGFFQKSASKQSKSKRALRSELLKKIEQKAPKKHSSIKILFLEYLKEKHPKNVVNGACRMHGFEFT